MGNVVFEGIVVKGIVVIIVVCGKEFSTLYFKILPSQLTNILTFSLSLS